MTNRRERLLWVLVGVAVVVVLSGASLVVAAMLREDGSDGTATQTSSAPRPTSSSPSTATTAPATGGAKSKANAQDVTVQRGLFQRQYLVLSPKKEKAGAKLPVVMVLHGLGIDRFGMAASAPWDSAVNKDGFIAVFPQGVLNSWNMGPCCPPSNLVSTDDVGFIDQVVAELEKRPDVDPKRMYLTGFSNGAIMTYSLACGRPGVFAKIAPVAGVNLAGCSPTEPISTLHLHGDPDPVVPYDGQFVLSQLLVSTKFPVVPDSVAAWAAAMGCDGEPKVDKPRPDVSNRTWSDCPDDVEVELTTYPGNGHTWPTKPVDGLNEILRFFDIRK